MVGSGDDTDESVVHGDEWVRLVPVAQLQQRVLPLMDTRLELFRMDVGVVVDGWMVPQSEVSVDDGPHSH